MANPNTIIFSILIAILILIPSLNASPKPKKNGVSFKMIHIDSPESPLYKANITEKERIKQQIQRSKNRAQRISTTLRTRKKSNKNNSTTSPLKPQYDPIPPMSVQDFNYLVKIGIGTFEEPIHNYVEVFLIVDTGSDLLWTLCEGCTDCFPGVVPFPKSDSKSYTPTTCNECPHLGTCVANGCEITRDYADGTYMHAFVATETFTFDTADNYIIVIPNIKFGCADDVRNFLGSDPNNKLSGVMGLSRGEIGVINQQMTEGRFGYCLQARDTAEQNNRMVLRFGEEVIIDNQMYTTPLPNYDNSEHYYLNLKGISVNDQRLPIFSHVFERKQDGSGGTIIDSGASFTYIVSDAWPVLHDAVASIVEEKNPNLRRTPAPELDFPLCYERLGGPDAVQLPAVTLHFQNQAHFVIQPSSNFYITTSHQNTPVVCFAMFQSIPELDGMSLLGVYQQVDQRIVFDVTNSQLHFGVQDCFANN